MSRYTYAGEYKNPTEGWYIKKVGDKFEVWVRSDREKDGSAEPDRKHTSAPTFDEAEDASEYITDKAEFYEEDYSDYLEENHDAIAAMERFEAFRNEQ
jgi:hypothetical protein